MDPLTAARAIASSYAVTALGSCLVASWHSNHIEYRGASFRVGDRVRLGGGQSPSLSADAVVSSTCANLGEGFIVGVVSAPSG